MRIRYHSEPVGGHEKMFCWTRNQRVESYKPHHSQNGPGWVICYRTARSSRLVSQIKTVPTNKDLHLIAVSKAVLDSSSARLEVTWSLELTEAQLNNKSTMHQRERDILFWLGNEGQDALRQQRARMVHEQHQFVEERWTSFVVLWNRSHERLWVFSNQTLSNFSLFVRRHNIYAITFTDPHRLSCAPGKKVKN